MAAIDVVNVAAYVDASIDLAQDFQNYTNDQTSQNYGSIRLSDSFHIRNTTPPPRLRVGRGCFW